jgi:hypothetical protein
MKSRTIVFSVQYKILYKFGSFLSSSLSSDSLEGLRKLMVNRVESARNNDTEAILFEPIVKTIISKTEARGSFVQFVPKLSTGVYYGEETVSQECYKPFKHRGSGRQGNSLQKSLK